MRVYIDPNGLIPVAVQGAQVSLVLGTPKVIWTALEGYGITEYEVYRKVNSGDFSLKATVTASLYDDPDTTEGNDYIYKVRGKDANGIYTEFSNEAAIAIAVDSTVFLPPTITGSVIAHNIVINIASNLTNTLLTESTEVEVKINAGTYSLAGTTETNEFVYTGLTEGDLYTFRAKSVNGLQETTYSNEVPFTYSGVDKMYLDSGQSNDYGTGQGNYPNYLVGPHENIYISRTGTFSQMVQGQAAGTGAEFNTLYLLQQKYQERIDCVKYAVAATRITKLESESDWHPDSIGEYYGNFVAYILASIANRVSQGANPQIQALKMHIGESDAVANVSKAAIKQSFIDFITAFRNESFSNRFIEPNLPIYLVRIHKWSDAYPGIDNVRLALEEIAAEVPNVILVSADDLRVNTGDEIHIHREQGLDYLGERVYNAMMTYLGEPTITDVTAPTVPTGLSLVLKSPTSITVQYGKSYDNVGIDGYIVSVNGVEEPLTENLIFTKGSLTDDTDYTFRVKSVDVNGIESPFSDPLVIRTDVATTGPQLLNTIKINFRGSFSPNVAGWNNMVDNVHRANLTPLALVNTANQSTGYSIQLTGSLNGASTFGGKYPNGDIPNDVQRSNWQARYGTSHNFKFDGQPTSSVFKYRWMSSQDAPSGEYLNQITMNGTTKQVDAAGNLTELVFEEAPDVNGETFATQVRVGDSDFAPLNYLIIEEWSESSVDTPPELLSATIHNSNPSDLVLIFNEDITGTTGHTVSGFTVSSVSGTGNTLTLTLNQAAVYQQSITYSYSGGDIQDLGANPLASIVDFPVTNLVSNVGEANVYTQRLNYHDFIGTVGHHTGRRVGVEIYFCPEFLADSTADVKWLVWCPGGGQYSTVSDASPINYNGLVSGEGVPKYLRNGGEKPYNVISIMLQQYQSTWDYHVIVEVLSEVKALFPEINTNRISFAGWSAGTGGFKYARQFPSKTGAVITMASTEGLPNNQTEMSAFIDAGVSAWLFHASNDSISYLGTTNYFNLMKASPGYNPNKHRMTLFTTGGHAIPDEVIAGTGFAYSTDNNYTAYPNTGGTYVTLDDFILANG